MTRSRAYKKNDQAWVEQKNGAIVRRLVGYGRLEGLDTAHALGRLADQRVHGTTGEAPIARFAAEAGALRPLGRAPFGQLRDLVRKGKPDCAIDLDANSHSVPWRLVVPHGPWKTTTLVAGLTAYSTASDRLFQQHPTTCSTGIRPVGGGGLRLDLHR